MQVSVEAAAMTKVCLLLNWGSSLASLTQNSLEKQARRQRVQAACIVIEKEWRHGSM